MKKKMNNSIQKAFELNFTSTPPSIYKAAINLTNLNRVNFINQLTINNVIHSKHFTVSDWLYIQANFS